MTLGISRNGQPMTMKVQLADRKKSFGYSYSYSTPSEAKEFHFEMPNISVNPDIDFDLPVSVVVVHSSSRSGLMVENLTPQLGDFFGTKNGQGVLVRSVEKGSRADKAGFRAGDVIVKINGEAIHDSGDFSHALRSRKDNTANVNILRDKKEQTITLTLPERRQGELDWESFSAPDISAATQQAMNKLSGEMARLKPEMDEAYRDNMADFSKEMQRQGREAREQAQELQRQMRDMKRQYRDQQGEAMKKLQKELQGLRDEI